MADHEEKPEVQVIWEGRDSFYAVGEMLRGSRWVLRPHYAYGVGIGVAISLDSGLHRMIGYSTHDPRSRPGAVLRALADILDAIDDEREASRG